MSETRHIRNEKEALRHAISRWYRAEMGDPSKSAWHGEYGIEDAILALDNAAYNRAFERAGREVGAWKLLAVDRAEEIGRMREDADSMYKSLGNIATQRDVAREELADARATISRLRCAEKED